MLTVGILLLYSLAVTAENNDYDATQAIDRNNGFPNFMPPHGPEPQPGRGQCIFLAHKCVSHPEMAGKELDEREAVYSTLDVGTDEQSCLLRAFANWRFCGSIPWEPVTMVYKPTYASRSFPSDEAVEEALQRQIQPLTGSGDGAHVSGLWSHERGAAPLHEIPATQSRSDGMGEWKLAFVWVKDHVSEISANARSFPQGFNGELGVDMWVFGLFHGKQNGFFIDLAANEAVAYSNTLTLERLGWEGLCIEAQSMYIPRLLHRKCKVVQAVVTGELGAYVAFNNQGHCGRNCGHVVKNESELLDMAPENMESYHSVTFERIIRDFRVPEVIDFLSLDIEGSEEDAMSTFPFETHKILSAAIERPTESLVLLLGRNLLHFVMHLHDQDGECSIS